MGRAVGVGGVGEPGGDIIMSCEVIVIFSTTVEFPTSISSSFILAHLRGQAEAGKCLDETAFEADHSGQSISWSVEVIYARGNVKTNRTRISRTKECHMEFKETKKFDD